MTRRTRLNAPVLFAALLAAQGAGAGDSLLYGKKLGGLHPTKLAELLDRPEAGKTVRLEGTIDKVCQARGCWLELKQGAQGVHVTFAGYSFFVPKDMAGKAVALEGRVVVGEPKAGDVEHEQSEGAGPAAASRVRVEATGVEISR